MHRRIQRQTLQNAPLGVTASSDQCAAVALWGRDSLVFTNTREPMMFVFLAIIITDCFVLVRLHKAAPRCHLLLSDCTD